MSHVGLRAVLSLALQAGPGTRAIIQQSVEAPCSAPMYVANTLTPEATAIFEQALVKRGYDLRLMLVVEIKRRHPATSRRVISPYGSGVMVPRVARIRRGSHYTVQLQIPLEGSLLNRGLACGRMVPIIVFEEA